MHRSDTPLFDELWDYDDPAATAERLRARLPAAETAAQNNPADDNAATYLAQLRTQLARACGLRGRFEEAREWLQLVAAQLTPALPVAHIRYLLEKGRVLNSSGDPDAALPLFVDACHRAQAAGADFYAVDAAHMAAIAVADPGEQLAWHERAIALAEHSDQERTRRWLGTLYNNVGWTYHEMARYQDALDVFSLALACRQAETGSGAAGRVRIARWCVARALRSLGRLDEALAQQQALAAYYETVAESDGYVEEELGEIWLALEQPDQARPHFRRAFTLLAADPWLQAHEPDRLARLRRLGGAGEEADE